MDLVYIPFKFAPGTGSGLSGTPVIETPAGWMRAVAGNTVEWVDRWLCFTALRLQRRDGLHLVRFKDGSEAWVKPHPVWDRHEPDCLEPVRMPMAWLSFTASAPLAA